MQDETLREAGEGIKQLINDLDDNQLLELAHHEYFYENLLNWTRQRGFFLCSYTKCQNRAIRPPTSALTCSLPPKNCGRKYHNNHSLRNCERDGAPLV